MLKSVTIIGGGPTGLMAADILSQHNYSVTFLNVNRHWVESSY